MKRVGYVVAASVAGLIITQTLIWRAKAAGAISLTTPGTYGENFNTLAGSGTSGTVPAGWDFSEAGTGANTTYRAGTGSDNDGDTYSFGAAAAADRAFGGLRSGSVVPTVGAVFVNNTGATITSLAVGYTGEQWRIGNTGAARDDRLDFQISTNATGLTTGTYTDVDTLDFTNPVKTAANVGALDGNAAANRTAVSGTITGLSISNGATFVIRWTDFDASGADDGLAVDDFSLTPGFSASSLKFRSAASGNWNANSTWEMSADGTTWVAATSTPTSASDTITVRGPHTVSVTAGVDADQLTVEAGGALGVNSGATFTVADGTGTDLTVNGSVSYGGTLVNNGLTLVNGTLTRGQGTLTTNPPTYNTNSTLRYDVATLGFVARGLEWSSTGGTGYPYNVQIEDFSFIDLGATGANVPAQIAGRLTINSGGQLSMAVTTETTAPMTAALTVLGNVNINGGTLTLSSLGGGDLKTQGSFTNYGAFEHNRRTVHFEGGSTQAVNDADQSLEMPYVHVNKGGGTVQLNTNLTTLGPDGGHSLRFTGSPGTLTLNGWTLTLGSTVETAPAGSGLVGDTSAGLSLQDGGTTGPMGNIVFAGGGQSLGNLTINRTGGSGSATLGSDLTLQGALALTAGDILTGSFTLTHHGNSSGTTDVVGNVRRTDVGLAPRSFGHPDNQIGGFAPGTEPSEITVNLVKSVPTGSMGFPGAVRRTYTITPAGGSGYAATLRLHYNDSELNGNNNEALLDFWRFDGTYWNRVVRQLFDSTNNWIQSNDVTQFSPWTLAQGALLTTSELVEFKATQYDTGTVLAWKTGYEVDNLGFNLYREAGGRRALLNPSPVAGSALVTGPGVALTAGNSYAWADYAGGSGARYYLEEIDLAGRSKTHGPFAPERVRGRASKGRRSPLLSQVSAPSSEEGQRQWTRADGAGAEVTRASDPAALEAARGRQRWLASRPAVKIAVRAAGWYRVTREQLAAAGLSPSADPARLQLYAGGVEVPARVGPDGSVEFYGQGLDVQSTDTRVYWLVEGDAPGLRTSLAPSPAAGGEWDGGQTAGTPVVNVVPVNPSPNGAEFFRYTVERRDRTIYFSGLRNGEAENFFGRIVGATPRTQTLTVRNLHQLDAQTAALEVSLQGLTAGEHRVSVFLNGFNLGRLDFAGQTAKSATFLVQGYMLREGDNQVQLASGGAGDSSLTDRLRLTYLHRMRADDDRLHFTARAGRVRVGGFTSPDVRAVDVTDPASPSEVQLKGDAAPDGQGGWRVTLNVTGGGERELYAFTGGRVAQPASVLANAPSEWSAGAGRQADVVVVTHRDFAEQLAPLVAQREAEGLGVVVVDVEDIFDEFSFGAQTPQAVRDFLAHAKSDWGKAPAYVLLVGDGSFDPRGYLGLGRYDLVPSKLVDAGGMETASDDWFADFDDDGIADIALGRLPVRTPAEASTVVNKIVTRTSDPSQTSALLVADRDGADGYSFESATDGVQSLLPAGANVSRINRRGQDAATVKSRIVAGVNSGPLVVNWMGHGSVDVWTGEGLLRGSDAPSLQNGTRLPLFVMMTCLNGYYEAAELDSLAESVLKAEGGGAYAVWASSGMTEPNAQAAANRELYRILFGEPGVRLGDAVRRAKAGTPDRDVRRTWVFFGDPSSRLR
jgi:hypothetical protein